MNKENRFHCRILVGAGGACVEMGQGGGFHDFLTSYEVGTFFPVVLYYL